jgi:Tfp pilus assembly protein PilE
MNKQGNKGFAFIGLIIALVIIIIWASLTYKNSKDKQNVKRSGSKAIEQTKQNNTKQYENQIEIQNNLNSIEN